MQRILQRFNLFTYTIGHVVLVKHWHLQVADLEVQTRHVEGFVANNERCGSRSWRGSNGCYGFAERHGRKTRAQSL